MFPTCSLSTKGGWCYSFHCYCNDFLDATGSTTRDATAQNHGRRFSWSGEKAGGHSRAGITLLFWLSDDHLGLKCLRTFKESHALQIIGSTISTSTLHESSSSLYSVLNLEQKTLELLHASSLLNCRANQRLLLQALEHVCTTGIAGVGTVLLGKISA